MTSREFRSIAVAIGLASALTAAAAADAAENSGKRGRARAATIETGALALPANRAPSRPAAVSTAHLRPAVVVPPVAVVSLARQTITVFSGTEVIAASPISSGMAGHRTPTGVFSIIQKARYHESNIYSGAPMPFMQRLTWSGIALHAGQLPGYPASHGCIRLPHTFAEQLFSLTRMGARVIVTHDATEPRPIAHARLPLPLMSAPSTAVAATPVAPLTLVAAGVPLTDTPMAPVARLLNPMQVAEIERRASVERAAARTRDARDLLEAAAVAARAADAARGARIDAETHAATYHQVLPEARRLLARAVNDEDKVQAEASIAAAEEADADARLSVIDARRAEADASDRAFAAARRARDAEDAAEGAESVAKSASRGLEPVTVFISRKDQRVVVRQGFHPLLEGDATIADPQAPLGTHVFTAVAADGEAGVLTWTAVTIADGDVRGLPAAAALDRITIEPGLAAEVRKRLWTGATLIVSDQGVGHETGKGTDIVVLTR